MHLKFLFLVGDDNSLIFGAATKNSTTYQNGKCCLIFRVTIKFNRMLYDLTFRAPIKSWA